MILTDEHGDLSARGGFISGNHSTSITIVGSLNQLNAALKTVTDTDDTVGFDAITAIGLDSFNGVTDPQTIAVDVTPVPPAIAAPGREKLTAGKVTKIAGVKLSEAGVTTGATFTAILSDTSGVLSATGAGVSGAGSTSLTITGTLSQVNKDLATLTDAETAIPTDTITVTASNSLGGVAIPKQIAVTITAAKLQAPSAAMVGFLQGATADAGGPGSASSLPGALPFSADLAGGAALLRVPGARALLDAAAAHDSAPAHPGGGKLALSDPLTHHPPILPPH